MGQLVNTGLTAIGFPAGGAAGGAAAASLPTRAGGGPVNGATSYLVGENGPELFTSSIPGNIVSNGALLSGLAANSSRGGSPATPPIVNVNITAPPGTTATQTSQSNSPGGGVSMDILIQQFDSALGNRIAEGSSTTGNAIASRFGLNAAAGTR